MFSTPPSKLIKSVENLISGWALSTPYSFNTGLVEIVNVRVFLKCKVASNGYSVGEYADLSAQNGAGSSASPGCCAAIVGQSVVVTIAAGGLGIRAKDTGNGFALAGNTSFDLVVRAYGR